MFVLLLTMLLLPTPHGALYKRLSGSSCQQRNVTLLPSRLQSSILTFPTRHRSLAACKVRLPCRLSLSLSKRLTRVVQNQAILHEESI